MCVVWWWWSLGAALVDVFSFSSLSWTDDDDAFPLKYGFYYSDGSGQSVSQSDRSHPQRPACLPLRVV